MSSNSDQASTGAPRAVSPIPVTTMESATTTAQYVTPQGTPVQVQPFQPLSEGATSQDATPNPLPIMVGQVRTTGSTDDSPPTQEPDLSAAAMSRAIRFASHSSASDPPAATAALLPPSEVRATARATPEDRTILPDVPDVRSSMSTDEDIEDCVHRVLESWIEANFDREVARVVRYPNQAAHESVRTVSLLATKSQAHRMIVFER